MTSQFVEDFIAGLEHSGQSFVYTEPPRPDCCRIRFPGLFRGQLTVWDATIMTLDYSNRLAAGSGRPPLNAQFLDVTPAADGLLRIRIGLAVARIDERVIANTIIMVRKYRRLDSGMHRFGSRLNNP